MPEQEPPGELEAAQGGERILSWKRKGACILLEVEYLLGVENLQRKLLRAENL